MKCREALKLLYEYLDRQLDNRTVEDIKGHLAECKHCFDTYKFEKNLDTFIREKASGNNDSEAAPETAVDRLKSQILTRISELSDESGPAEDSPPRFFLFKPAFAVGLLSIAAVLILAFYFTYANKTVQAQELMPLVEYHQKALEGFIPMDVVSNDIHTIDSCLSTKIHVPSKILIADDKCFPLMAKVLEDNGRPCAHIVYNASGKSVSVFLKPIDIFKIPREAIPVEGYKGIYSLTLDDKSLLMWHCINYWYVAVGELEDEQMLVFVSHLKN